MRGRRKLDPLIIFQIYMALLIFSPSIYIVPGLGAAGTPATIFGCLIFVLWVIGRVANARERIGGTPLHWAVGVYCVAVLLSFCAGMLRPISAPEVSSSLRGLIALASGVGVILFTADSMRTRPRLEAFLRFAVLMGFFLATMGIIQFLTGINFVEALHPPGLTPNSALIGVYQRSGFPRISATAIHSIEFSAVVGMVLPLAAHFAVTAKTHRWWQWAQFGVMLIALPLTISRSGAVALIVGLLFVLVIATKRMRVVFLVTVTFAAVAFRFLVPGMLGTIRSLFTGAGGDISIDGRVGDYQAVAKFVSDSPWIGRGFGTFLPELYRTLDNQFLGTAIEAGLIGAAALALLFLVPIFSSTSAALQAKTAILRTQGFGIAAGVTTALVLALTFDEFGFPMAFGMLCLMLGASGAFWRVTRASRPRPARLRARFRMNTLGKVLVVSAVTLGVLGAGGFAAQRAQGNYEAKESVLLRVPESGPHNVYDQKIDAPGMSDLINYFMDSPQVRSKLAAASVTDYSVAIGTGSLSPFTDVVGHGDLMWIAARADTPSTALADLKQVRSELVGELSGLQHDGSIPANIKVGAYTFAPAQVFSVAVYRSVALGGVAALAFLSCLLLALALPSTRTSGDQRPQDSNRAARSGSPALQSP